jgi:hypothetical protein
LLFSGFIVLFIFSSTSSPSYDISALCGPFILFFNSVLNYRNNLHDIPTGMEWFNELTVGC